MSTARVLLRGVQGVQSPFHLVTEKTQACQLELWNSGHFTVSTIKTVTKAIKAGEHFCAEILVFCARRAFLCRKQTQNARIIMNINCTK